jgi:hypothetical protein
VCVCVCVCVCVRAPADLVGEVVLLDAVLLPGAALGVGGGRALPVLLQLLAHLLQLALVTQQLLLLSQSQKHKVNSAPLLKTEPIG